MSDLPPLNDDDELLFEPEAEKPKRHLILDDGELPFEIEVEKPKKRPPSRLWRKTYIPVPLLLAICALLICSSVLLLSNSFANGSLLCKIPFFCSDRTAAEILALVRHDPRPPFNASRVMRYIQPNAGSNSQNPVDVTVTPAQYTASRCDPNADYSNHLMFTMEGGDNTEIFVIRPDGTDICRVTDNLIEERQINWSPDRKHIVFMSMRSGDGATDIYEMNFDGTNIVNLTQDQRNDFNPVWSPDGTQIAFSSEDPSGPGGQIYVINEDGSNRRNLTPDAAGARSPTWSPDGSRIAYVAGTKIDPNNAETYTVQVGTGNIQKLTSNIITEDNPVWSPDGSTLFLRANTVSELGKSLGMSFFTLDMKDQSFQSFTAIPGTVESVAFSPDQNSIAYIADHRLSILDIKSLKSRSLPTEHSLILSTVSWR